MYVYFFVTAVASALMFAAWKLEQKKHWNIGIAVFAYFLIVVLFSIVAGARDSTVGIDTWFYGIPSYKAAISNDFHSYMTTVYTSWQPFVKVLTWCVANLTHSAFWYFFSIEFVISALVVIATRLVLRERAYLGIIIYGVMFYPITLSIMRQFMGMGFLLLSIYFVFKRKPIPYLACIVVGALFHSSCLLGLLIYPIYLIGYWKRGNMPLKCAVLAVVTILALLFFGVIAQVLYPYFGHFSGYLVGSMAQSNWHQPEVIANIVVFVVFGSVYWWLQRVDSKEIGIAYKRDPQLSGLAFVVAFGVAIYSLTYVSHFLFRLGHFFLYFAILLIPMAQGKLRKQSSRCLFCATWLFTLCCYGYLYYDFCESQEVVPYILA